MGRGGGIKVLEFAWAIGAGEMDTGRSRSAVWCLSKVSYSVDNWGYGDTYMYRYLKRLRHQVVGLND